MSNKEELLFLKEQNFVPSKKMGQNFLINQNVQRSIVEKANINTNDCILEIGPGLGAISQWIIQKTNHYLAIELDKRLHAFLSNKYPNNIFINNDILKVDLDALFAKYHFHQIKVVANLPYSISSLIIMMLLKNNEVKEIIILIQKEMAERLLAKINTKDYNAFTVLVNSFCEIEFLMNVSHHNFYPQPKVASWLIKLTKKNNNLKIDDYDQFLKICFSAKRKKLMNNLLKKYDKEYLLEIFNQLNLDLNIRPENIDLVTYEKLYRLLSK